MWLEINEWKSVQSFIKAYEDELRSRTPKFSGNLSDSIKGTLITNSNNLSIDFEAADYFNYIDKGVNGTENSFGSPFSFGKKMPPPSSLSKYAGALGVSPFVLAKSIQKKGIKPRNIIDESNLEGALSRLGDDIIEDIWDLFYKNNK